MRQLADDLSLEDVETLVDELIEEMPGLCREIENAVAGNDATESHRLTHSFRGTASIFGLQQAIDLCQALEHKAGQGRMAEVRAMMPELKDAIGCSEAMLRATIQKLQSNAGNKPSRP